MFVLEVALCVWVVWGLFVFGCLLILVVVLLPGFVWLVIVVGLIWFASLGFSCGIFVDCLGCWFVSWGLMV